MPDQPRIRKRPQLQDAILGLRVAQSLSDEALVAHYASESALNSLQVEWLERACDTMEQRIAAFRLELQAQRSPHPAYAPATAVDLDDIPF